MLGGNGLRVDDVLKRAQLRGERSIAVFRIVVASALLILIAVTLASNEWQVTADDRANIAAAAAAAGVGVVAYLLSERGIYRKWFTYLTAATDVLLVAFSLWTAQYAANASLAGIVSANTFSLFFVAIIFTLRRFDRWNTIFSATFAALLYAAMAIAVGRSGLYGTVLSGTTPSGYAGLLEVNAVNETIKVIALLLCGYIGYGIVRANRRLFDDGLDAEREIERVTSTFGRYVSADLAESILHTTIESAGEEREASVVFIDIVEFTNATERLTPTEVFRAINIFVSHVIELANQYKGFINKFIGDAVMIVFGAPLVSTEHRERAIDFACSLSDRQERINEELRAAGIEWDFRFGVGVNTGSVYLGNIGNEERAEYTAIGDAVNVAARLEKATHRHHLKRAVLVGEASYSELRATVLREIGSLDIRGKSEPVRVYQVV